MILYILVIFLKFYFRLIPIKIKKYTCELNNISTLIMHTHCSVVVLSVLFTEESFAVVDHEFEECICGTRGEVGEEGLATRRGQSSRGHLVPLTVLCHL